jgi:hypothetical protein
MKNGCLNFFALLLFLFSSTLSNQAFAQFTQPMVFVDAQNPINTTIPFNNTNFNRRTLLYSPNDFTNAHPGHITKIYLLAPTTGSPVFNNLKIVMGATSLESFVYQHGWPTSGDTVLFAQTYQPQTINKTSAGATGVWMTFDLQTPFYFDNINNFYVDISHNGFTQGMAIRQGTAFGRTQSGPAGGNPNATIDQFAIFGFDWQPMGPCQLPLTPPTIQSSTEFTCAGKNISLTMKPILGGSGLQTQWQKSLDGINWNNLPNGNNPQVSDNPSATTNYRLRIICQGDTLFSTSAEIQVAQIPLQGGTYTINSALPSQANNFNSLKAFADYLSCVGLSGPITANIAPGSGPYSGQVIFDNINFGAGTPHPIVINGNQNEITFTPALQDAPAVFWLKQSSNFTISDLKIRLGTGAPHGMAVQLSRLANNNAFIGCEIDVPLPYLGIRFAAVVYGESTTGATNIPALPQQNTLDSCLISGGHYGVIFASGGGTTLSLGNKIENCTIRDFHMAGIYSISQEDYQFLRNDISRANRDTVSLFYGIFLSGNHRGGVVAQNSIHDPSGPVRDQMTMNPVHLINAHGTAAKPNFFINNQIFSIFNEGQLQVIRSNSSSHWKFYHNTLHVEDSLPLQGWTHMFYLGGTSDDVAFINNLIYLKRGGLSNKFAIYVDGFGNNRQIDHNAYFTDFSNTSTGMGFTGSTYASFADWQNGNPHNWDVNAVFDDPDFTPGTLIPNSALIDNRGQNLLSLVPTDILDTNRTVTPDPGAYEFEGPPCANPLNLDTLSVSSAGISLTWDTPGQTAQWDISWGPLGYTPNPTSPFSTTGPPPFLLQNLPPGACYDIYIRANCSAFNTQNGPWIGPLNNICMPYGFDIGIHALINPNQPTTCGEPAMPVLVTIQNNGDSAATNIPITSEITGSFTATLNAVYPGPLLPGTIDTVLMGTLNTAAGGNIDLTVFHSLPDQNQSNDTLEFNQIHIGPLAPVAIPGVACPDDAFITLGVQPLPAAQYYWYNQLIGGTPIGTGPLLQIPITSTDDYFVEYGTIPGTSANDSLELTINGTNGHNGIMFDVMNWRALEIIGFTVFPRFTGQTALEVWHKTGTHVGFESQATAWTLIERIPLTVAGMPIRVDFSNTHYLPQGLNAFYITFENGNMQYTHGTNVGQVISQNGDINALTGRGITYPFGFQWTPRIFDGRIHYALPGASCLSQRTQVPYSIHHQRPQARFTANFISPGQYDFDASASTGHLFDWHFGDGNTDSGILVSHQYATMDNYNVTLVVIDTICAGTDSLSQTINSHIATTDIHPGMHIQIHPNPSSGKFHLERPISHEGPIHLQLTNSAGQVIYKQIWIENQHRKMLDLSGKAKGIYTLHIQTNYGLVYKRLILI